MAEPLRARAIRGAVIGLVASLLLAVAGAFGTDQVGFGLRLGYWLAVILPGSVLGLFVTAGVKAWGRLAARRWLEMAVAATLVAVPHTFVVVVASAIVFAADAITPATVLAFFSIVLLVSLVLTAINYAAAPRVVMLAPVAAEPAAPPPAVADGGPADQGADQAGDQAGDQAADPRAMPAAFAERLPLRLRGGQLIALAAEDHYLRVHTNVGNDLVLMRMADAVAYLGATDGARVHRSWWVARAAVTGHRRDGDRLLLLLEAGLEAPVSRAAKPVLAAAGWF
jgi:DNA-binding LytR/AlgR family response regulator